MTKVSKWVDLIISRAVIFIIAFIWLRYYLKSLPTTVLLAAAVTAALSLLISLFSRKRNKKKNAAKEDAEKTEEMSAQFIFSGAAKTLGFFHDLLKADYNPTLTRDCLLAETQGKKAAVFAHFRQLPLNADALTEMYIAGNKYSPDKFLVFTNGYTAQTEETAERLQNITLMDADETYGFLKSYGAFPALAAVPEKPKKKRRRFVVFLAFALAPARAKGYLFGAFVMILGSLFVRYQPYYLSSASVFLTLALLCRVNFKFKKKYLPDEKFVF